MSASEKMQVKSLSELRALDASNHSHTSHILKAGKAEFNYTATAASITVYDKLSKPLGRIFYIAYKVDRQENAHSRPLTFVFNGGPGASSAYLHLGALGPKRVVFDKDGTVPPMPARIRDNPKSWLAFTDLVFVDPLGTGYSRELEQVRSNNQDQEETKKPISLGNTPPRSQVWDVEEDTDLLSRFIRAYLTKEDHWLSPIYLVGESYGGFRVARLSRQLQTDYGIAPSGLVLISPVLDFSFIRGGEHSLWPWVVLLPSYAAVAAIHQRSDHINYVEDQPRNSLAQAERSALSEYLSGLAAGTFKLDWLDQTAKMTGLDNDTLLRWSGRVPPARFVKALLSDQRRLLSLYDGSITLIDPQPAEQLLTERDLYLDRLDAPLTAAFNSYVRGHLNFKTDLPYLLRNENVFESWNWRSGIHNQQGYVEAVSDLKQAMSLNPDMHVRIIHGVFDFVTPYLASEIIIRQMALNPRISDNIQLKVYHGGHMPYLHHHTLNNMYEDAAQFYKLIP